MADYYNDGMIKVAFVPTITNVDAPTVAEITAGVDLEGRLTADGLNISGDTASVDTSKLNSSVNSETIGRDSYTVSLTYVRGSDSEATDVQDALVRGAAGYLVVRSNVVSTTAWTAAQEVEVYPVMCKRPIRNTPAPNSSQTVVVALAVTDGGKVRSIDNPGVVAA